MIRLIPLEGDTGVNVRSSGNQTLLTSKTEGLQIVGMVGGIPTVVHKPHPGLVVENVLSQNRITSLRWAIHTDKDEQKAVEECMNWLRPVWASAVKRSRLRQEQSVVQIHTGDTEIDEALFLSQVQSERLLVPASTQMPFPTMLSCRQPDDPTPTSSDASMASALDGSINIWELYHASHNLLIPGHTNEIWGMIRNFIQLQRGDGHIDFQPGLSGTWTHLLAAPLLAGCVLDAHRSAPNLLALREAYPILGKYLGQWLGTDHDTDQDYLPVWQNSTQSGWEDNPLFDASAGYPTWSIESPACGALLYREAFAMSRISRELGIQADEKRYSELAKEYKSAVLSCWDHRRKIYQYRDAQSHLTSRGIKLSKGNGPGSFSIDREFDNPERLNIIFHLAQNAGSHGEIQFLGYKSDGEHVVEKIPIHSTRWVDQFGSVTSSELYSKISSINISGMDPKDAWQLTIPDLTQIDLSLFLPLWAGIPDEQTGKKMIETMLLPNWAEFFKEGLAMLPMGSNRNRDLSNQFQVNPIILSMVIDGLIHYGYREDASRLVMGLMKAIIKNVKTDGYFHESWDALSNAPMGRENHICGLPPIGVFLRTAGLEFLEDQSVAVFGENPFEQDIDIRYKGLHIHRGVRETEIIFKNEPPIIITGTDKKIISWRRFNRRSMTEDQSTEQILLIAVVQAQDSDNAAQAISNLDAVVTRLPSVGGFLGRRNTTMLIGVRADKEIEVMALLQKHCRQRVEYISIPLESAPLPLPSPTPVTIGGATVFSLEIEHFEVI